MTAEKLDSLYKYCSADDACHILGTQRLRWSSPDCFADPFELSSQVNLGFDTGTLLDSTIKLASSMIFAPEQPAGDSPLINAIKRWRGEGRFASPKEAHGVLRELLGKMVDHRSIQLEDGLAKWQQYVRNVRICCFTGKPDNILAWERFANDHTGVAVRFAVNANSSIKNPRAMIYQSERANITTLREQLGAILHNRKDGMTERFSDHFFIKAQVHKAEDEWRCMQTSKTDTPVTDTQSDAWYDDVPFHPREVTDVYFGLNTPDDAKQHVVSLLQEHFKDAKAWQAVIAKLGYAIEFERPGKS